MYRHILGVGALFYLFLIAFLRYFQSDGKVDDKELSVFFTTFVMLQVWNMFNARALGFNHSAFRRLGENKGFMMIMPAIVIIQFFIVQYGGNMFRTEPLSLTTWFAIIAGTSLVLWAGEAWRHFSASHGHGEIADASPFEELSDR